ncbi:VapE domain-containing protein [Alloprevotella sp. OH1205_COT-284]|uniref:VapE domain-containing protein n=1 Tax=Alloprevotella sp. OH1205_COT-284 TaxID=2491043 RepID=UPI0013158F81|nr:VapE domain-containing protein [Alloprevotella sp. OH1205_COT-284]
MYRLLYFCVFRLMAWLPDMGMRLQRLLSFSIEKNGAEKNEKSLEKSGQTGEQPSENGTAAARPQKHTDLHGRLLRHLEKHYELRFNLLTESPEFRRAGSDEPFESIDRRNFNSLTIEAVDKGIGVWSMDMERLLHSDRLPAYHPLTDYMERLPEWDGRDRVEELSLRIARGGVWREGFGVWLRAMAAQWMGRQLVAANALVPLLVSREQGMRKSTFCRMLMPPELADYYTDHPNLTAVGNVELQLAKLGLINLDEFDRYTPRQNATLKNLLQLSRICRRRAYRQQLLSLSRTASFIATSNERELLTDLTGSRRFLCIEISKPVDCTPIDHAQLFAQLRDEVVRGEPTYLTHEQETRLQMHNAKFRVPSPATEVFWEHFRLPQSGERVRLLTATEIFVKLQRAYPAALRGMNASRFGRTLRSMGLRTVHQHRGNCYRVVEKEKD